MMSRRFLKTCFFAVFAAVLLFTSVQAYADTPVAVLDLSAVMEKSAVGKDLIAKLKVKAEALQKESESIRKSIEGKQKTLLKERDEAVASKSDEKIKAFEAKRQAYEGELKKTDAAFGKKKVDLQRMEMGALREIQESIAKISADVADEKKIQMVIDRKSVVIAQQGLDITAEVLKRLDEKMKTVELKIPATK
ncbi:MAG: OmpH family outer membrane protein [Pseudobdellovibrionaceae bacterium]